MSRFIKFVDMLCIQFISLIDLQLDLDDELCAELKVFYDETCTLANNVTCSIEQGIYLNSVLLI